MIIGTTADGRLLEYNQDFYLFAIGGAPISLEEVRELDAKGAIAWEMPEQRDWLHIIDPESFKQAQEIAASSSAAPPVHSWDQAFSPGPAPVHYHQVPAQASAPAKKSNTPLVIAIILAVAVLLSCGCCFLVSTLLFN